MPRDWNAESYQRVSAPLEAMGREVLDRLELRGDERVLDAGCGTGRVTAALLERLPRGEVVAVDGSPAMAAEARERLGPRADVRVGVGRPDSTDPEIVSSHVLGAWSQPSDEVAALVAEAADAAETLIS